MNRMERGDSILTFSKSKMIAKINSVVNTQKL